MSKADADGADQNKLERRFRQTLSLPFTFITESQYEEASGNTAPQ